MSILTVNDASKRNMTTFHPATTYINERMNNVYIHTYIHVGYRTRIGYHGRQLAGGLGYAGDNEPGLNALGYN